jgi:hydrogenase nickel incorporation protein HypA/HybF
VHEYSIVRALIDQVDAEVRVHSGRGVRNVQVRIGELSGVEPDLLMTAYEISREGTICSNAELLVERVPARWCCTTCGCVPEEATLRCNRCGAAASLIQGDEILLTSIEMEVS